MKIWPTIASTLPIRRRSHSMRRDSRSGSPALKVSADDYATFASQAQGYADYLAKLSSSSAPAVDPSRRRLSVRSTARIRNGKNLVGSVIDRIHQERNVSFLGQWRIPAPQPLANDGLASVIAGIDEPIEAGVHPRHPSCLSCCPIADTSSWTRRQGCTDRRRRYRRRRRTTGTGPPGPRRSRTRCGESWGCSSSSTARRCPRRTRGAVVDQASSSAATCRQKP